MIEQCVIMARPDAVGPEHLNLGDAEGATESAAEQSRAGSSESTRDPMNLDRMEREFVVRALDESRWNITQTAKLLGVSRDTLRYRIEKYGFSRP